MDPLQAFKTCTQKFATFRGTASRSEFWWFLLSISLISTVASRINDIAGLTVALLFLVPVFSVGARRLHETGKTGWWQLILLIPLVGMVVYMILMAMPARTAEH